MPADRPITGYFPALSAGWTLYYEMFFYAVFAVAIVLPRYFAVAAATAFLYLLVHAGYWDAFLFEFVFGMLIAVAYRLGFRVSPWLALLVVPVAIALWLFAGLENFVHFHPDQQLGCRGGDAGGAVRLLKFGGASMGRTPMGGRIR